MADDDDDDDRVSVGGARAIQARRGKVMHCIQFVAKSRVHRDGCRWGWGGGSLMRTPLEIIWENHSE